MENTRAHPSVEGWSDPRNSQYYMVIVQVGGRGLQRQCADGWQCMLWVLCAMRCLCSPHAQQGFMWMQQMLYGIQSATHCGWS